MYKTLLSLGRGGYRGIKREHLYRPERNSDQARICARKIRMFFFDGRVLEINFVDGKLRKEAFSST